MDDLSFDPRDPWFPLPGTDVEWAVQVFTRDNVAVVDPDLARLRTTADGVQLDAPRLARAGRQRPAQGQVRVEVRIAGNSARWQIEAEHPTEPVKAVKLLLRGLDAAALDSGWWSATSARAAAGAGAGGAPFQWTYPSQEWMTPWACAGGGEGAVALSVRDTEVRHQRLHVDRPPYAPAPIVEVVHHQLADRRATRLVAPQIVLTRCEDDAAIAAAWDEHLRFVEQAHALVPWERRADVPAWLDEVDLVLTLHGQHWTGHVFNTFAAMEETLRRVCDRIDGRRVLAYLPGWEGRYYRVYPSYEPGEQLGGTAGLAALVATVHVLGGHVMPMFGAHGAHVERYPGWEQAAFRNDTDRWVRLLNVPDWDGDRAGEGDQVFLNPGEPAFGAHLASAIDAIVRDYGVDGAFLDTASFWFDDPRHNLLDGYRTLLGRLRTAHPGLLIAAEGWFDAMLGLVPLAQQWLGVERDMRLPELLTRYARTTAHLAEGAPGPGSTGVHELGYRPRPPWQAIDGHIPSISIVDDTLGTHASALDELVGLAAAATRSA